MLLKNLIIDPDSGYIYLERYVNVGSPSGFTEKYTTSASTSAKSDIEGFYLYSVDFPQNIIFQDYGEKSEIINKFNMLIHPDMIDDGMFSTCTRIDKKALFVIPISSARTVKVAGDNGWFLKLCYKGLIGRIDRQLAKKHALAAVEVSKIIENAFINKRLPNNFYFYRELSARVFNLPDNNNYYEWGLVTREPRPYPSNSNLEVIIPGFSLFSPDDKKPDDPTLLTQLIQNQTKSTTNYLLEDLIFPIFDTYFQLLLNCGLQLEAHAQNILFAFSKDLQPIGIIARDAESIDRDLTLIEKRKLDIVFSDNEYKCLHANQYNYEIMHSFMFDFKLGEYLIKPIIEEAAKNFDFNKENLINKIKEYNKAYIDRLPDNFFPADGKWYSYESIVHNRNEKRNYIANANPLCR